MELGLTSLCYVLVSTIDGVRLHLHEVFVFSNREIAKSLEHQSFAAIGQVRILIGRLQAILQPRHKIVLNVTLVMYGKAGALGVRHRDRIPAIA